MPENNQNKSLELKVVDGVLEVTGQDDCLHDCANWNDRQEIGCSYTLNETITSWW